MLRCSAFISKVKWELHESFRVPIRTKEAVDGENFECGSTGWGYFDIPITIYFTKETGLAPLSVYHSLSFDNGGEWQDFEFDISESYMKKVLGKK